MRKKIVAGNWKMNKTFAEGVELAREVNDYVRYKEGGEGVLVVLGTPFIHLAKVAHNITESSIMVAAQNCATEKAGAYTGEISAEMIASTGAKCVILGHSERRSYYGETSPILVKKVAQALESKLEIIFCVGEVLEERAMKMLDGHGWIPDYVAVVRRSDLLAPTKDDLINKTPLVVLAAAKIGTTRLIDNVEVF